MRLREMRPQFEGPLTRALGFRTRELALRLDGARLTRDRAALEGVAREADTLGLGALARDARR